MANQEQYELLIRSVADWNQYRAGNPDAAVDLRGADLDGAYLDGADLRGADLEGADLHGAYLAHTILIDAGQDHRGYRFVGVPAKEGLRILAGCRWFSECEAVVHWTKAENLEALAKVRSIVAEHNRRQEAAG